MHACTHDLTWHDVTWRAVPWHAMPCHAIHTMPYIDTQTRYTILCGTYARFCWNLMQVDATYADFFLYAHLPFQSRFWGSNRFYLGVVTGRPNDSFQAFSSLPYPFHVLITTFRTHHSKPILLILGHHSHPRKIAYSAFEFDVFFWVE